MRLAHLSLTNFRNYRRLELELPAGVVLFVGDNAQGKTALLEAVYYLATSRSPHTTHDRQLIHWDAGDEPLPFSRVVGDVAKSDGRVHIEVVVVQPPGATETARLEKRIKVDGVTRRAIDLLGQINVVLFSPDDVALVAGSPSIRRRYLDATLCQIDSRYCQALAQYRKILAQRNSLLRRIQTGAARRDELRYWDETLVEHGAVVTVRRHGLLRQLETRGAPIHRDLTGGREAPRIVYRPSALFSQSERQSRDDGAAARAVLAQEGLDLATTQATFQARLSNRAPAEIAHGTTLVGPHRDDFTVYAGRVDIHTYGSRGQQRTAVLALKLAETEIMRAATGESPLLLLDDVMSELDAPRRAYVSERMLEHEQTLATATDWTDFSPTVRAQATGFTVTGGTVAPAPERSTHGTSG